MCFFSLSWTSIKPVFVTSHPVQGKVVEAVKRDKEIRDELDDITVRVQQMQPKLAQLRAEEQAKNKLYKAAEVSNYTCT